MSETDVDGFTDRGIGRLILRERQRQTYPKNIHWLTHKELYSRSLERLIGRQIPIKK